MAATTVVGVAGASGLTVAVPRADSSAAVTAVVVALSAQQRETDAVAMGALERAHEALATSEARNAALERELATLRAASAASESVHREEHSVADREKAALEEEVRVLKAAHAAVVAEKAAIGAEIHAATEAVPFMGFARRSYNGYASIYVDFLARVEGIKERHFGIAKSEKTKRMERDAPPDTIDCVIQ